MDKKKQRSSQFELLRILAMIFIVVSHQLQYNVAIGLRVLGEGRGADLCNVLAGLGNNIFIMISSWFLVGNVKIRFKGAIMLVVQVVAFSTLLYLLSSAFFDTEFSVKGLLMSPYSGGWWFPKTYLLFVLLVPFSAQMISALSKKSHLQLICILFVIWLVHPSYLGALTKVRLEISNFIWFLYVFLFVSYLKMYPNRVTEKLRNSVVLLAVGFLVTLSLWCVKQIVSIPNPLVEVYGRIFYFSIVILALSLIVVLKNVKPFYSKIVNLLGSATFGVYLIHEYSTIRNFLWADIFQLPNDISMFACIFRILTSSILVFLVCASLSCLYNMLINIFIKACKLVRGLCIL